MSCEYSLGVQVCVYVCVFCTGWRYVYSSLQYTVYSSPVALMEPSAESSTAELCAQLHELVSHLRSSERPHRWKGQRGSLHTVAAVSSTVEAQLVGALLCFRACHVPATEQIVTLAL